MTKPDVGLPPDKSGVVFRGLPREASLRAHEPEGLISDRIRYRSGSGRFLEHGQEVQLGDPSAVIARLRPLIVVERIAAPRTDKTV